METRPGEAKAIERAEKLEQAACLGDRPRAVGYAEVRIPPARYVPVCPLLRSDRNFLQADFPLPIDPLTVLATACTRRVEESSSP
jgi:hypothetical protein